MKVLRSTFVAHLMSHCLRKDYVPLNPSEYGWAFLDGMWEPVWFEGDPLPDPTLVQTNDENDEIQEEEEEENQ